MRRHARALVDDFRDTPRRLTSATAKPTPSGTGRSGGPRLPFSQARFCATRRQQAHFASPASPPVHISLYEMHSPRHFSTAHASTSYFCHDYHQHHQLRVKAGHIEAEKRNFLIRHATILGRRRRCHGHRRQAAYMLDASRIMLRLRRLRRFSTSSRLSGDMARGSVRLADMPPF